MSTHVRGRRIGAHQFGVLRQGAHTGALHHLAAGGQRIGVVHRTRRQPHHVVAREVLVANRLVLQPAVRDGFLVAEIVDPGVAGELVGHVDLTAQLRLPGTAGPDDAGEVADLSTRRGEGELEDVTHDHLLGVLLGAHRDRHPGQRRNVLNRAGSHLERHGAAGSEPAAGDHRGACRDLHDPVAHQRNPFGLSRYSARPPNQSTSSARHTASTLPRISVTLSWSL